MRLAARRIDYCRDTNTENNLGNRDTQRTNAYQFEILPPVALVDLIKALLLVVIAAECLNYPVTAHYLFSHLGYFANRILNTARVAAKRDTEHAYQRRNYRKQHRHKYCQRGALIQHDCNCCYQCQHITYRDSDHAGN